MKLSARLLTLALIVVPAVPATAAVHDLAAKSAAAPVLVARYNFDGGAPAGRVAELSGRGTPLTVRGSAGGTVRFFAATKGKYAGLPGRCTSGASTCARALLEGVDDPDLDPGTRSFRWGATIKVAKSQLGGSANVVQKGVATTESQWKMQVGAAQGKAQCVVVGRGSAQAYVVKSTVGVADNAWHKVLCLRAGNALSVYVDGALRGRITVPAALNIANDKPLRIGGPNFNASSDMYHGYLDDVYAQLG